MWRNGGGGAVMQESAGYQSLRGVRKHLRGGGGNSNNNRLVAYGGADKISKYTKDNGSQVFHNQRRERRKLESFD